MILGFARGTGPRGTAVAQPIHRFGRVLLVREAIHLGSFELDDGGGPIIDARGRVVGITAGDAGGPTIAIRAEHVRRLLDRAKDAPLP